MVSVHCYCKNMIYGCNDYICMLCVQQAIKGRLLFCYHHHRWWCKHPTPSLYVLCGRDKSVSPPNHLVTRHWLNNHQRWIVVQGDGDHDLCSDGSYAEAMVMFTSTDVSAVEATAKLHRRQSGRSTKRRCWRPLHQGSMCPHNGDDSLHTGGSFANAAVLVYTHRRVVL